MRIVLKHSKTDEPEDLEDVVSFDIDNGWLVIVFEPVIVDNVARVTHMYYSSRKVDWFTVSDETKYLGGGN